MARGEGLGETPDGILYDFDAKSRRAILGIIDTFQTQQHTASLLLILCL